LVEHPNGLRTRSLRGGGGEACKKKKEKKRRENSFPNHGNVADGELKIHRSGRKVKKKNGRKKKHERGKKKMQRKDREKRNPGAEPRTAKAFLLDPRQRGATRSAG